MEEHGEGGSAAVVSVRYVWPQSATHCVRPPVSTHQFCQAAGIAVWGHDDRLNEELVAAFGAWSRIFLHRLQQYCKQKGRVCHPSALGDYHDRRRLRQPGGRRRARARERDARRRMGRRSAAGCRSRARAHSRFGLDEHSARLGRRRWCGVLVRRPGGRAGHDVWCVNAP